MQSTCICFLEILLLYFSISFEQLFQGNVDNTNAVRYDLDGLDDITFVRFEPQSWNGSICMRVALYGYFNPSEFSRLFLSV